MDIVIEEDGIKRAKIAADVVERAIAGKDHPAIGIATGSSPLPLYDELVRRYEAGKLSFANVTGFTLDEYVGLPPGHPEGYRIFIEKNLTNRVDFKPENLYSPDGNAEDILAMCAEYDAKIASHGGVDVQVLGIGSDGHIAFNEPGGSLVSRTHPEALTEATRKDNSRFFDYDISKVPTHCVTQGLGTIMSSHTAIMMVTGENKAKAVRDLIEGPVSARCPGSILQHHPDITVVLDEAAASLLEIRDFYVYRWQTRIS